MYSNSLLEDTPSTSAASSPADYPPALEVAMEASAYDPGPAYMQEEVAMGVAEGDLLGSEVAEQLHVDEELPLPVPPPTTIRGSPLAISKVGPESPALNPEPLVDADVSDGPEVQERGHVRSPVLAREPSALESFSRTIRGYVPSSIPIPSVAPTPPRVSRPLSFGTLLSPTRGVSSSSSRSRGPDLEETTKRRGSDVSADHRARWREQQPVLDENDGAVFSLDEEVAPEAIRPTFATRYPGTNSGEEILWSAWDSIEANGSSRRVLLVGYRSGFQMWDCSNLGSISEILNLSGSEWNDVHMAAVLPNPLESGSADPLADQRPAIGIVRSSTPETAEFLVYSLRSHTIVKSSKLPSLHTFTASRDFLVLSATQPPALHVLSSRTFTPLYIIPSSSLVTFAHHTHTPLETNTVLSPTVDPSHHSAPQPAIPSPIFSLSNRLLAYASPPPKLESPLEPPSRLPRTASQSSDDATLKFPMTQAELGSAAVKIGGSVLSGMKVLGGMAFTAARAGVSAAATAAERRYSTDANTAGAVPGKFFSRSAPAASGHEDQRYTQAGGDAASDTIEPPATDKTDPVEVAHHVTIVDLAPLLTNASQGPTRIAEFLVGKDQPVSLVQFSADGTSLLVALRGGHVMKAFQLRPTRRHAGSAGDTDGLEAPWHIYDLRRGRTSAIVDSLTWAHDGRWMAVATEKGTVHVFATNPYGGPSDERSHLDGRVVNPTQMQPLSTEVHPLIRLRVQRMQGPDAVSVPVAFTFLPPETHLPSSLSPSHAHHQDTLLFDPRDGTLSLRRIALSKQTRERVPSTFGSVPLPGGTSISLPGASTLTAQVSSGGGRAPSALTKMMTRSTELVATENVIATWTLRRAKDWKEIRRTMRPPQPRRRHARVAKPDWLSQAELSTHSRSTRIVPRSLYLAHQFSFYTLGEDYHGLLRSFNFDVPAAKVEVRRQIEVNASGSSMSESFVSGSSLPSQSGFSTSYDEAVSVDLRTLKPSPPVLPMYPNGPPSRAYMNSMPIRNVAAGISDGMTEGLGRLRREIGKVRSPRLAPKRDSLASVPLEFDEEDEDFLPGPGGAGSEDERDDVLSHGTSREGEGASPSTPSTNLEPIPAEDDGDALWEGWGPEDKQAVEEIEQFDDIAVGFMDEDAELARPVRRR
ncbi:hypothetical protein PsYK624_135000 [Phanerochaete sordida]|uniref:BCAS3 WD40 domain-containing protein n=1 Tax=Phanerochaete sordida TaxID=48140 RepID=A0A9P3LK26_9APHY|nr:hypothetical protein PsYK624_135000 [Phanerochaete sordida]